MVSVNRAPGEPDPSDLLRDVPAALQRRTERQDMPPSAPVDHHRNTLRREYAFSVTPQARWNTDTQLSADEPERPEEDPVRAAVDHTLETAADILHRQYLRAAPDGKRTRRDFLQAVTRKLSAREGSALRSLQVAGHARDQQEALLHLLIRDVIAMLGDGEGSGIRDTVAGIVTPEDETGMRMDKLIGTRFRGPLSGPDLLRPENADLLAQFQTIAKRLHKDDDVALLETLRSGADWRFFFLTVPDASRGKNGERIVLSEGLLPLGEGWQYSDWTSSSGKSDLTRLWSAFVLTALAGRGTGTRTAENVYFVAKALSPTFVAPLQDDGICFDGSQDGEYKDPSGYLRVCSLTAAERERCIGKQMTPEEKEQAMLLAAAQEDRSKPVPFRTALGEVRVCLAQCTPADWNGGLRSLCARMKAEGCALTQYVRRPKTGGGGRERGETWLCVFEKNPMDPERFAGLERALERKRARHGSDPLKPELSPDGSTEHQTSLVA
jgi:hypothetical protein